MASVRMDISARRGAQRKSTYRRGPGAHHRGWRGLLAIEKRKTSAKQDRERERERISRKR